MDRDGGDHSPTPTPTPSPPVVTIPTTTGHGYWLVGSDGGIFSFGAAQFYGSTGDIGLQRPVVGITPTSDDGGYWLVASDGGVFSFGDSQFYGSIPASGSTRRALVNQEASTPQSWASCPRLGSTAISWLEPAMSSPSVTPSSKAHAPASVDVPEQQSQ